MRRIEKRGGETKNVKRGQAGSSGGYFKKRGAGTPYKLWIRSWYINQEKHFFMNWYNFLGHAYSYLMNDIKNYMHGLRNVI